MDLIKKLISSFIKDKQLYLYVCVGGSAAIVDFIGLLTLNAMLTTHYLVNNMLSFMLATFVNYVLCRAFVFQDTHHFKANTQLSLTYLVSAVGLGIQSALLWVGIEWLNLALVVAKLNAMGVAFFWNFLARKHWVFKPQSV